MCVTKWPDARAGDDWRCRDRIRVRDLRRGWGLFLGRLPWRAFVTLTFDPAKAFPVGEMKASSEAFWWCGQTGRLLRRPIGWIYATERGRHGQWHAHALFTGLDVGELKAASMMWRERNGAIKCQRVSDVAGVALYTTKDAAMRGEIVWSDTLARYRDDLQIAQCVALHPV